MKPVNILCLLSDFGTNNRFTGIMKGVACTIDPQMKIYDITHDIEPYNIIEAAYLLADTIKYWPEGTVFSAVVDPGVGSHRKPVGIHTKNNRYIICPDNGLLTVVRDEVGIREIRDIIAGMNSLPGITKSSTFDGRDVFVYNAARLAAGKINFRDLGLLRKEPLLRFELPEPRAEVNQITGAITYVEKPFGNLSTNIKATLLNDRNWLHGKSYHVILNTGRKILMDEKIKYVKTFSDVKPGALLIYIDSEQRVGIARNKAPVKKDFRFDPNAKLTIVIKKEK